MYAGLPVIGTDIPGIRDVLPEESRQWLFSVGRSEVLALLIGKLGESDELMLRLGAANRRHVESHFSQRTAMYQWDRVICSLNQ
jgi:glycosyltransferase involved in cell wall biosynthesis